MTWHVVQGVLDASTGAALIANILVYRISSRRRPPAADDRSAGQE